MLFRSDLIGAQFLLDEEFAGARPVEGAQTSVWPRVIFVSVLHLLEHSHSFVEVLGLEDLRDACAAESIQFGIVLWQRIKEIARACEPRLAARWVIVLELFEPTVAGQFDQAFARIERVAAEDGFG